MRYHILYSKSICLSIFLLLTCLNTTFSQESFSFSYNYGSIVEHTSKIEHLITTDVKGFTINYSFANKNGNDWRTYFNYPNYGVSYNFKSYGYNEVLGNSHSVTSFLQLPFFKNRKFFDIGFEGYAGVGYFTKIYDPVTNPLNNAISGHVNISADIRIYTKLRLKPVYFQYSVGLNHFSNGLIKAPNLGVNVANNSFTIGYELEDQAVITKPVKENRPPLVKNEYWGLLVAGIKQSEETFKTHIFNSASINYSKQVSQINKIGIGFDFINDPLLTENAIQNYNYSGESNLNFRYGFNIHNEMLLGNTGFFTAYGFYFGNFENYVSARYYKVGFKYYFKNIIAGALIRATPLFRADVVEFGIGYRFY